MENIINIFVVNKIYIIDICIYNLWKYMTDVNVSLDWHINVISVKESILYFQHAMINICRNQCSVQPDDYDRRVDDETWYRSSEFYVH